MKKTISNLVYFGLSSYFGFFFFPSQMGHGENISLGRSDWPFVQAGRYVIDRKAGQEPGCNYLSQRYMVQRLLKGA